MMVPILHRRRLIPGKLLANVNTFQLMGRVAKKNSGFQVFYIKQGIIILEAVESHGNEILSSFM